MGLEFQHLLRCNNIDPAEVWMFRHTTSGRDPSLPLRKLASERLDMFDAYQKNQNKTNERRMRPPTTHVAAFVGLEPRRAHFVRLYKCGPEHWLSYDEFWAKEIHEEMRDCFGYWGHQPNTDQTLYMDLYPDEFFEALRGRLIIEWSGERNWVSKASGSFPVLGIAEHRVF